MKKLRHREVKIRYSGKNREGGKRGKSNFECARFEVLVEMSIT